MYCLFFQNFTSLYLSMDTREDMDSWLECLTQALERPSSIPKEQPEVTQGACAGTSTIISCNRQWQDYKYLHK